MIQINRAVKSLRARVGLSQARLAALAGLSPDYINRIERGKCRNIGLITLERIAQALGVSINELLLSRKNEIALDQLSQTGGMP